MKTVRLCGGGCFSCPTAEFSSEGVKLIGDDGSSVTLTCQQLRLLVANAVEYGVVDCEEAKRELKK